MSAILEIYRLFWRYIYYYRDISTILEIYRLFWRYIDYSRDMSTILEIWRLFWRYIDYSGDIRLMLKRMFRTQILVMWIELTQLCIASGLGISKMIHVAPLPGSVTSDLAGMFLSFCSDTMHCSAMERRQGRRRVKLRGLDLAHSIPPATSRTVVSPDKTKPLPMFLSCIVHYMLVGSQ
jgi:hypothetical protein